MMIFAGCLVLTLAVSGQQPPPRDPRAAAVLGVSDAGSEAALQKKIAETPSDVASYLLLSRLQENRGAYADAEATLKRAKDAAPQNRSVYNALAGLYNRQGDFEQTISALETAARLAPSDPTGYQLVATYYWEKAQKDKRLLPAQRWTYIAEGIAATDSALAIDPDYAEALTYKNILLRMRSQLETDPAQQKATIAEADALRNRAMELNKARVATANPIVGAGPGYNASPPPPPPPPPPPNQAPIRVGGGIAAPTKTKHVPPIYPPDAQAAQISGIVIIEATIATDGRVYDTRVLKSIPGLDQAATEAVRQWEFTPTLLNGVAVPVIMTVTVNFTRD